MTTIERVSSWGTAFVLGLGAAACDLDGRALDVSDVGRPEAVVEAGPTPPSRGPDAEDTGTGTSPPEACEGCPTNAGCTALGANAPCTVNGRAGECSRAGSCREYCVVDVSRVDECLVQ